MHGNDIGPELENICEVECAFNKSLPGLRTSFCVPLVAMVHSSRVTVFVAKSILVLLGLNSAKLVDMFDAILFPRLLDDEENI